MSKKIITFFVFAALVASLTACGVQQTEETEKPAESVSQTQDAEQTKAEQKEVDSIKSGDFEAKILDCTLSKDDEGNDAVTIKMEFTNNSSEAMYFNQVFYETVFQNGIEQSADNFYMGEGDWDSYYKEIKDGATLTIYTQKPIANTTDPVEVTIDAFEGNAHASKTFNLK